MTFYEGNAAAPTDLEKIRNAQGEACINGSIHNIRAMGEFAFVILRTGTRTVQCVYSPEFSRFSLSELREGDCVKCHGQVVRDERAQNGFEIRLHSVEIFSGPAVEYPFAVNKRVLKLNIDTLLNYRPLTLRNPHQRAIFKVQESIAHSFADYMRSQAFTEIHTPKIVAQGAEGGANTFKLDYFGRKAFLNQSPQFYKQTMVGVFERVFEIAPVYRAEKHSTSRHLNEYIGLDFEMGYISGMEDIMEMETAMLRHVAKAVTAECAYELELMDATPPRVDKIPAITFMEARDIIASKGKKAGKWDLEPEDEQLLCDYAREQYGSEFIFITHFPAAKRPFYAMDDPADDRFALSFDLLFRGIEITTGGQRIHDYNMQIDKMKRMGLDPEDFRAFLMIHQYGMPPHGGLGIGLERLTMKFLGLQNVREASLFPRDTGRLLP